MELLRELLPDVVYTARYLAHDAAADAPGMLLKHYAPRAELIVFDGAREPALDAMRERAAALLAAGRRVGVVVVDEDEAALAQPGLALAPLGPGDDLAGVAQHLFAALRALDASGLDVILARALPRHGLGLAVWDRLVRAAEGRVEQIGR
jgi:L-threonylcarbamoyladenylate synthase